MFDSFLARVEALTPVLLVVAMVCVASVAIQVAVDPAPSVQAGP